MFELNDTIVAPITPTGVGAISVIRISGSNAIDFVNPLFSSKNLSLQATHTMHYGTLKSHDSVVLDEVVVALYKSPNSFTGEDVVEISCHGSSLIQNGILNELIIAGARMARPGEFTMRAFLNGKLDLVQAESVADLINSNSVASRNASLKHLRGNYSKILHSLRDELVGFSSLNELELDFAEEDVEFMDRTKFSNLIENLISKTSQLIDSFRLGNVIKNGVQTAIVGKVNSGKSTLLNTLLNENRAIVSDIAGTTRDTIEEVLNLNGIIFRLIDTAGIRNDTNDEIEKQGIQRSLDKINTADLVIYLFDVNSTTVDELQAQIDNLNSKGVKYILLGNKIDVPNSEDKIQPFKLFDNIFFISAQKGTNVEELKTKLIALVTDNTVDVEGVVVTNARHIDSLKKLLTSLLSVQNGLNSGISGDILSIDIKDCLYHLGVITGKVTNDEQLDFIFSKFCIGK